MSSRGSKAKNGHVTTSEYHTSKITDNNVKILEGNAKSIHSLPDYSHSPNAVYAKLKPDGKTLHELRIYNESGKPVIEIAYHPEPYINNNSRELVVHFHLYDENLNRFFVGKMSDYPEIKEKYKKYLKEFDLYDKC